MEEHPFKAGMRVAYVSEFAKPGTFVEKEVLKVYKTGKFILFGDPDRKQWTPRTSYQNNRWYATVMSDRYGASVYFIDEAFEKMMRERREASALAKRAAAALDRVRGLYANSMSLEQVELLEQVSPPTQEKAQ